MADDERAVAKQRRLEDYYDDDSPLDAAIEKVREFPDALCSLSDEFRTDRQVVLAAVQEDGSALRHVPELWTDRPILLAAVKAHGSAIRFAPTEFMSDREIVLVAVRKYGAALLYASAELRADRKIVLAAVKRAGSALQHASPELQADWEIVLAAVQQDGKAFRYCSAELRDDQDFAREYLRHCPWGFQFLSPTLQDDKDTVLTAIERDRWALRCASDRLKEDPKVLALAIAPGLWENDEYEYENLTDVLNLIPKHVISRLRKIVDSLQKEEPSFGITPHATLKATNLQDFAENVWKSHAREKIWLLKTALPAGMSVEEHKNILVYSDIPETFHRASELAFYAPAVAALTEACEMGRDNFLDSTIDDVRNHLDLALDE